MTVFSTPSRTSCSANARSDVSGGTRTGAFPSCYWPSIYRATLGASFLNAYSSRTGSTTFQTAFSWPRTRQTPRYGWRGSHSAVFTTYGASRSRGPPLRSRTRFTPSPITLLGTFAFIPKRTFYIFFPERKTDSDTILCNDSPPTDCACEVFFAYFSLLPANQEDS